ncbi:MAG: hypothetical protein WC565_08885 [Parcubacteria group bacterium]
MPHIMPSDNVAAAIRAANKRDVENLERSIRAAALEEAAKVCDQSEADAQADYTIAMRHRVEEDAGRFSVQARTARALAAAIRSLKEPRCTTDA